MSLNAEFAAATKGFALQCRLDAAPGETIAVVGESGAGKTTALRCIAGLMRPLTGRIAASDTPWYDSARRIDVPPHRRELGYVFARGALFGHMSALENVAFGLRAAGANTGEARERALFALALVEAAHLRDQRALSLSGGETQRVAIARAIALRPPILLLDEPLSALDMRLRPQVREALRRAIEAIGAATVLVTHEPAEAMLFAKRFVVLEQGRVVQAGDLQALRDRPASPYVASFSGTNLYRGEARLLGDGSSAVLTHGVELMVQGDYRGPVDVVVDPDAVTLSTTAAVTSARNHFSGVVESIAPDRGAFRVSLASRPPISARVTAHSLAALGIQPGAQLHASFKAVEARIF